MSELLKKIKHIRIPIIALIGGLLGAYAGADQTSKNWRRIGLPLLYTAIALICLRNWWMLTILAMTLPLRMGYGIPNVTDKGSLLGRFFYKLTNYNHYLADVFTRETIGLLVSLTLISIPLIKGNWFVYLLCSFGIILTYAFISWRDLGVVKVLKKNLLYSDIYTYSVITAMVCLMIKF